MRRSLLVAALPILIATLVAGCPPAQQQQAAKPAPGKVATPASEGETTTTGEPGDTTTTSSIGEGATTVSPDGTTVTENGTVTTVDGTVTPAEGLTRESVEIEDQVAILTTSKGDIYVYFYPGEAPNHVRNFLYLAQKDFYRDVPFHRVIKDFMIQGGEARADWTEPLPPLNLEANVKRTHIPGALAAARTSDPNSANSQFYLVLTRERSQHLDKLYTVFGQAFKGQEVITAIGANTANYGPTADAPDTDLTNNDKVLSVRVAGAAEFETEIAAFKEANKIP